MMACGILVRSKYEFMDSQAFNQRALRNVIFTIVETYSRKK